MTIHATRAEPVATAFSVFEAAHPAYLRHVANLRQMQQRELDRLRRLARSDRHSRVRKLLRWRPMHELAAYNAVRALGGLADATPASIQALADRCDPFSASSEAVSLRYMAKRGRTRIVASFGPIKRMHQLLVSEIVRVIHPPRRDQFLYNGGMPAAFKAVEAAIAEGFIYGAEVDMVGFYSSVRLNGLAELLRPLPESVVRHVIWDDAARANPDVDDVPSASWANPSLNRQPGLALGSASSPLVAERIIATLLSGDLCRTVTYADNILVVGENREEVAASLQHLQERTEGFVGWRLRPRMGDIVALRDGFEFLHHFATGWDEGTQKFQWAPDERKMNEYRSADGGTHLDADDIAALEAKVTHWRRAYPTWRAGDQWEARILAMLAARRFFGDATPLNQSAAISALITSYFSSDGPEELEELIPDGATERERRRRVELLEATRRRVVRMVELGRVPAEMVVSRS